MAKVKAWMNHGVWKATCPECGNENLIKQDEMVCATCNPDILATVQTAEGLSGRKLAASLLTGKPLRDVSYRTVPDIGRRAAARRKAIIYQVEYDQPKDEVMRLLRPRRKTEMNYYPTGTNPLFCDESLDDLRAENAEHGLVTQ